MREVKYRGMDVMTGQWLYGNLLITGTGLVYIVPQNLIGDLPFWQVDKDTVGQITGLKDKNGVEIYEGDILLFNNSINNRKWKCVVKYREGSFVCVYPNDNIYNHFDSWNVPKVTWEVIGNIYQHSELLEVQHDSK